MKDLSAGQEFALAALERLLRTRSAHDALRDAWRDLFQEGCPPIASDGTLNDFVGALDVLLQPNTHPGDGLASYFLWDCNGQGRIVEIGGGEWPITSVEDIRAYLCGSAE